MVWKPKEKELTQEEAIALAKKELSPFWFGSTPQIAGVQKEDRAVAIPLEPDFGKKAWLMLFIDPTDFMGQTVIHFAKEWHTRYSEHELQFLLIFIPTYGFLRDADTINRLIETLDINFPLVMDLDGLLSRAFDSLQPPRILLLDKGKIRFVHSGSDWMRQAEVNIQSFLRISDPGLPLLPVYDPTKGVLLDVQKFEFGSKPRLDEVTITLGSEFKETENGTRVAQFYEVRPKTLKEGVIFISGAWEQSEEKISTRDQNAVIAFKSPTKRVSVIAESLTPTMDTGAISVEVNHDPAYEAIAGADLVLDDSGQSIISVKRPKLYHILVNLPANEREVTLKFNPISDAPISIYGVRFGE